MAIDSEDGLPSSSAAGDDRDIETTKPNTMITGPPSGGALNVQRPPASASSATRRKRVRLRLHPK
ncbi:hypothetical protein CVT26_010172 [Gymnopilus dilepis]|uniref:Uncharacterized protein n=1 Tax=Gymnopilus dilepis TaxID=231916 RepID=A0A409W4N8_9AGAR|nr:hypothetical protein CVT26_010172 [Gymnopilus dilepis]